MNTVAVLAGFIIGSVVKIWPWKLTVSTRINSHGETVPFIQENLLPWKYSALTGNEPYLLWSALLIIAGVILVILLDRLGRTTG